MCRETLFYIQRTTSYVLWNTVLWTVKDILCVMKHCSINSERDVMCLVKHCSIDSERHFICSETLFSWKWKTYYVKWNTLLLTVKKIVCAENTVLFTVKDMLCEVKHYSINSERHVMCCETCFYPQYKNRLCAVKHCSINSERHVMCRETLFYWQWKTCYVQRNTVLSRVSKSHGHAVVRPRKISITLRKILRFVCIN